MSTQEQRRKRKNIAETESSSNSELLALLEEMKEEMKERDEQIREELRWRENHNEDQIKKKENTIATTLQQRVG